MRPFHVIGKAGERHHNTKHDVAKLIRCRKLMQPPLRMKAKDAALAENIPYETMMRKLEEYGV